MRSKKWPSRLPYFKLTLWTDASRSLTEVLLPKAWALRAGQAKERYQLAVKDQVGKRDKVLQLPNVPELPKLEDVRKKAKQVQKDRKKKGNDQVASSGVGSASVVVTDGLEAGSDEETPVQAPAAKRQKLGAGKTAPRLPSAPGTAQKRSGTPVPGTPAAVASLSSRWPRVSGSPSGAGGVSDLISDTGSQVMSMIGAAASPSALSAGGVLAVDSAADLDRGPMDFVAVMVQNRNVGHLLRKAWCIFDLQVLLIMWFRVAYNM